jgi:hypothetical protein
MNSSSFVKQVNDIKQQIIIEVFVDSQHQKEIMILVVLNLKFYDHKVIRGFKHELLLNQYEYILGIDFGV